MNRVAQKFNSMWGAVLVICVTIVVASAATATAAKVINGKYIKKNTVTTKQIKNGTIVKADLNKNLSVTGATGATGPKGDAGATTVVSHRVVEAVGTNTQGEATADCASGEKLVGGGASFANQATGFPVLGASVQISNSVPLGADGKPAADLGTAVSWYATGFQDTGATRDFVVIALCAKP